MMTATKLNALTTHSGQPGIGHLGSIGRCFIVHYDFLVETSPAFPRIDYLAEALGATGLPVEVLCRPAPHGAMSVPNSGPTVHAVADPKDVLNRLITGQTPGSGGGQGLSGPSRAKALLTRIMALGLYPDLEALWSWRVAKALAPRLRPGDLVITCSRPESAGLVGRMALARGAWWWFDFADGWCHEGIRHDAHGLPRWRVNLEKRLERRWVGQAHGISTVNANLAAYFDSLGPRRQTHVYPNVVPRELAGGLGGDWRSGGDGKAYTILYFGRLKSSDSQRGLTQLADILVSCPPNDAPKFLFCGEFGPADRAELEKLRQNDGAVSLHEPIPRAQLPQLIAAHGVKAMLVVNSPDSTASTSKLFDGLGLGVPTLLLARDDSEAARLVRDLGAGVVVPPRAAPMPWGQLRAGLDAAAHQGRGVPPECDGDHQAALLLKAIGRAASAT